MDPQKADIRNCIIKVAQYLSQSLKEHIKDKPLIVIKNNSTNVELYFEDQTMHDSIIHIFKSLGIGISIKHITKNENEVIHKFIESLGSKLSLPYNEKETLLEHFIKYNTHHIALPKDINEYNCLVCNTTINVDLYKFCPGCGIKFIITEGDI